MKIAAILFDLGDVIMKEETEVKDPNGDTISADLVDEVGDVLRTLAAKGYAFGLVADTRPKTAWNVLHQHNLYELFGAFAISDEVGVEKPDARIFRTALNALDVPPEAYGSVLMVGNNRVRDIRGANELGLVSVWFHWNDRYAPAPDREDIADYEISEAKDLLGVVSRLELE